MWTASNDWLESQIFLLCIIICALHYLANLSFCYRRVTLRRKGKPLRRPGSVGQLETRQVSDGIEFILSVKCLLARKTQGIGVSQAHVTISKRIWTNFSKDTRSVVPSFYLNSSGQITAWKSSRPVQ